LPESFEELLLVKGVTRELLFGETSEDSAGAEFRDDESEASEEPAVRRLPSQGAQDHVAWASLLTWQSAERNVSRTGRSRINLNTPDLAALHKALSETFDDKQARFVVLYRQYGPAVPTAATSDDSSVTFNPGVPARFPIVSVIELIDARVPVPSASGKETITVASPFTSARDQMRQYLPKLLEDVALDGAPLQIGRVNINTAHSAVLAAIPGIDRALVEQIVTARENQATGDRSQPGWLLTDGLVDVAKLRMLLPYITCGSDVHRAEIVGFFDGPGPVARREVVIDATRPPARLVYWKDLRSLDARYPLDLIGTEDASRNDLGPPRPRAGRRNMQTQTARSAR
jgi:DNA uptake protein ComE-like DNA-binding protein